MTGLTIRQKAILNLLRPGWHMVALDHGFKLPEPELHYDEDGNIVSRGVIVLTLDEIKSGIYKSIFAARAKKCLFEIAERL